MILKLLILLFSTGILVQSVTSKNIRKSYNEVNHMFYGWYLRINTEQWGALCFGTFVAPRIYITDPICLRRGNIDEDNNTEAYIVKIVNRTEASKHITFNTSNIYYGEDLDNIFDKNGRKIAVVRTNEAVEPEQDKNGYVKINPNLDDIDVKRCFIPAYNDWMVKFSYCDDVQFDNRDGNPANVYCLSAEPLGFNGSGLFCFLKSKPNIKVLVGIVAGFNDKLVYRQGELLFNTTVENISGLSLPHL
ncbi:uncharacterized protein LOC130668865 [Microplitis mediator]|uniref:uncharacterized protein LOC130668865 n=1 Tax=Microplitis mediator TaxID=375433 RepID=UPI002557652A|nr:uncharacterized protein LOC130668865 [Microplitis mediator]